MTEFALHTQAFQFEDLSWDLTAASGGSQCRWVVGGTIDVSKFDATTHYPNGYLKSGCVLGQVTAGSLYAPYKDTLANGQENAVGLLVASVPILLPTGVAKTKIGVAILVHGMVSVSHLPYNSTDQAATGGFIDADGRADLPFIYWAA